METNHRGIVYLVGAGPGDPGLLTLRGAECLHRAEVVVYDRLINKALLGYAPQAELIDVGKKPRHHTLPQDEINALLIEKALAGKIVVRLKGGDPFVFGRGGEEGLALYEAGVPFEVVPGVTSAVAVPAYAGIPITHRDVACSALLITGHRTDCTLNPEADWARAALGADTLVFLMGVKNLPCIVEQLIAAGRPPETPVAMIRQGTHSEQVTVTGTLADIVERAAGIRPPAIIVIGEVVRLRERLNWFEGSKQVFMKEF
jgi:uroporphyrinogen III methyltransferase/synthase